MTPEFLEALLDGRSEEAAQLLDVELPEEFPRKEAAGGSSPCA